MGRMPCEAALNQRSSSICAKQRQVYYSASQKMATSQKKQPESSRCQRGCSQHCEKLKFQARLQLEIRQALLPALSECLIFVYAFIQVFLLRRVLLLAQPKFSYTF